jgi:hypothetical protein
VYLFRLWTQAGREAIAKAELDPMWRAERASLPPYMWPTFDAKYPRALAEVTHNIHPLVILGIRRTYGRKAPAHRV